jgi:perosamine synthetase
LPDHSASDEREFVPVSRPFIWGNEAKYAQTAIESGWISSRGTFVNSFERMFAEQVGVRHAVTVTNGTAALHLALSTLGIGAGDEVIVPDFCMMSPVLAILYCGATPVTVDVDETWNLDPSLIGEKITERTRAILVVHNYGHPAAMEEISEIARRRGVHLVEDGAEALGATVNGRQVGTFGELTCFSFYANKVITTGEGGMVVTDDPALHARACWKRDLCFGPDDESRFVHRDIGFNFRMTNVQAAIGVAQMEHFDEAVAAKIEVARRYNELLEGVRGLTLPPAARWAKNVYWVYGVVVEPEFGISRAELQKRLRGMGIETRRFFAQVQRQPILSHLPMKTDCPRSAHLAENGFYLPSYIGMKDDVIERVARALRSIQP